MMHQSKASIIMLLVLLLGIGLSACSGSGADVNTMNMAPLDSLPAEIQEAPATVRQSYQFAVSNPDILTQIPCYCGCGAMGHTSNYACYISGADEDGNTLFDTHALGCSICVDITQDTMRMLQQGQSVVEIRTYVDQTYAQYGPSNMP